MTQFLSFLFGALAKVKRPSYFADASIKLFISFFKIDLTEAKEPEFDSLYSLFTREIKRDLSDIKEDGFIHPVDGELVSFGKVENEELYLIKGKNYLLKELVGDLHTECENYFFYNYYLSPKDYHRVHHPVAGEYVGCKLIRGALYPVAKWFVGWMPNVFSKNSRTVSVIKSPVYGKVLVVMVGALNVGSLEMSKGEFSEKEYKVKVGDHLGTFGLGSSVVVLTSKDFTQSQILNAQVKFGTPVSRT